jgi:hypothetical protein
LTFGYLAASEDVGRYAGTSYSFLGFDDLTRFEDAHYKRMFRVLRTRGAVRPRAANNPGGPGHGWVKSRFVDPATRHGQVVFLPRAWQVAVLGWRDRTGAERIASWLSRSIVALLR